MQKITLGTVISGTHRAEDLIPAFAARLEYLDESGRFATLIEEARKVEDYDGTEASYILEELFDGLDEYAPPCAYFGSSEGNGSDFGFWVPSDWEDDYEGLMVDDLSEVDSDYEGLVMVCYGPGEARALYEYENGVSREVWSI